jgi:hypothetical protein
MKKSILFNQVFVLLFFCHSIFAINIKLLKGTHTILPEEDRTFSPFWGLTFWEKDVAKQFYTFSLKQLKKKTEEALKDIKPEQGADKLQALAIFNGQDNTATEKLVSQMFVESGGSFNVTNAPDNPVRLFTPKIIGQILRMVSDYQKSLPKNGVATEGKAKQAKQKLPGEQLKDQLKTYLVNLKLQNSQGGLYSRDNFKQFVNSLVDSVQESATGLYAEGTAQGIVLGYLLAKSNTRQDLADYFTGFMGKPVTLDDKEPYTSEQLKKIKAAGPNFEGDENFGDFVCAEVYQDKYASSLPKVVENKSVTWTGVNFSDCIETIIRNLANIATFNSEKQKLGDSLEDISMSQELKSFYDQGLHQDSGEVGNYTVHQAWLNLMENKPGMVYGRLLVKDSTDQLEIDDLCEGVIPVDVEDVSLPVKIVTIANKDYEVRVKNVDNKVYWLVPKLIGLLCCEVRAIASNIIVAMNDLFNLGLDCSVENILQPHFASNNFSEMCKKLKWSISEKEIQSIRDMENGTERSISVDVTTKSGESFGIGLIHKRHGTVSVQENRNSLDDNKMAEIDSADGMMQAACMSLGIIPQSFQNDLGEGVLLDGVVLNPDSRLTMIKQLINKAKLTKNEEQYLCKLIMSMGDVPNELYQKFIFEFSADLKLIFSKLAQALMVMATVAYVKNNGPEMYVKYAQCLVDPNKIKDLIIAMEKEINNSDSNVQRLTVKLLNASVKQGLVLGVDLPKMFNVVEKGLNESCTEVKLALVEVLNIGVKQGLIQSGNLQKILNLVEKGLNDPDQMPGQKVRLALVEVLNLCVEKGLISAVNIDKVLPVINGMRKKALGYVRNNLFKISQDLLKIKEDQSKLDIAKNVEPEENLEHEQQETQKTETTFDAAEHKQGLENWKREEAARADQAEQRYRADQVIAKSAAEVVA